MDYSTMIDEIMPLVKSGDSDAHFIISRKDGEWEIGYLGISPERYEDSIDTIREYDPCAVMFAGGDFSRGSYELFMDTLRAVSPLPIKIEPMNPEKDGVCRMGDCIAIREGMSEIQTVCAAIHEITHAVLHDQRAAGSIDAHGADETRNRPKDRSDEEIEAEGVSYVVCQYFGIETGANSLGYVANWSKNRELKELNAALDTIRKTAAELIDSIDGKFRALAKKRGIDLSAAAQQGAPSESVATQSAAAPPPDRQPDYANWSEPPTAEDLAQPNGRGGSARRATKSVIVEHNA